MGVREEADARLEAALAERGARDPREFYRERLKALREQDAAAYEAAVAYYRDTLVPTVAKGDVDPLEAWTGYGLRLAELSAEGRTVSIDRSGRSKAHENHDPEALVLHLPDAPRERALLVHLPADPSAAQRATYSWLVAGRNKLPDA
jgi:hypothetical protein